MVDIDRRTTLALMLGAGSVFVAGTGDVAVAAVGDETKIADGVTVRILGEGAAMIPGYQKVRLRDITFQPGASFPVRKMTNAMICHTSEGEPQVDQVERKFAAVKGYVWTCAIGTEEGAANKGTAVAVMRVADLLTS
jgi:hypothetical protein